jgi:hypothetical protein
MQRRSRSVALLIAALSAGASCRDHFSTRVSGLYVLRTIDGKPLPATVAEAGSDRFVLIADSLRFDLGGQVQRKHVVRWINTSLTPGAITVVETRTFPYSVDGTNIVIGPACTQDACSVIASDVGTIDVNSVRLMVRILWPGEPLFVFTRPDPQ